jgi:hypothetical protein
MPKESDCFELHEGILSPPESLETTLSETDVCELFNCNKNQLSTLRREKQLPFLKINNRNRLYFESDIINWLADQKTVLNKNG